MQHQARRCDILKEKALQINRVLSIIFQELDVRLVDFKLEFGETQEGEIILADEISPDTCRLWDETPMKNLIKMYSVVILGSLTDAYEKILQS